MMLSLKAAVAVAAWINSVGLAQAQASSPGYTVYASVVFARTGERTSILSGESLRLTSYGASQMYNLGAFFRNRYIGAAGGSTTNPGSDRILGLSANQIDNDQLDIVADDAHFTTTSAEAFMQAFYPPWTPVNTSAVTPDPSSVVNGSYHEFPLNGYQYAAVNTYSTYNPENIWIDGTENCLNYDISNMLYSKSAKYQSLYNTTLQVYKSLGADPILAEYLRPADWSASYAYWINDFVQYMVRHNSTIRDLFTGDGRFASTLPYLEQAASQKEWDLYGDTSVYAQTPGDNIMAVAGRTLAGKIVGQMEQSLTTYSLTNKLSLYVGEFPAMISLLSLLQLGDMNERFRHLPTFGSAMAFELFSYNSTAVAGEIPNPDTLFVRFLFRNGSNPTGSDPVAVNPSLQAYPMFKRSPSKTDMPWSEFKEAMSKIYLDLESWCTLCQSRALFCAAFLEDSATNPGTKKHGVSPAVGGVIGAIVTLAVAGLLFGAAMFFGGLRFHRREKSNLGGFKGSAKLASDADLSIPNNAAPFGVSGVGAGTANADAKKGHERVGSWELKNEDKNDKFASLGSTVVDDERRASFEADDEAFQRPVQARESF